MTAEDVERRAHWFQLARELGQEDDFRALLDDVRRQGAAEACVRMGYEVARDQVPSNIQVADAHRAFEAARMRGLSGTSLIRATLSAVKAEPHR